ncbi:YfcC family protein [Limisphaera ngatamarikiensis]|uniref:YfcC family protein n=2 Tax=Limisphaera ngatamarikiensis TaxID=1324935 RepID=A0A6M1RM28_9BACT|nr:YfcC family protein [Limisphaera ngatamarikiensis]
MASGFSFRLQVPHTLVLLFWIMGLAWAATWVLPQGRFETVVNERGRPMVVPGTYQPVAEPVRLMPWVLFTVVPRALADAQAIIFFLLIVGGALSVIRATGALDAAMHRVLRSMGNRPRAFVAGATVLFAAVSATLGCSTEYIPLTGLLVGLCAGMRLDAVTACGVMVGGYCIGYGAALMNPYTVIVAQEIAGLPPTSGLAYRLAWFIPFVAVGVGEVWRHVRQAGGLNPGRSEDCVRPADLVGAADVPVLTVRHGMVLGMVGLVLVAMVWGITVRGWYLVELGALWLGVAAVGGLVGGLGMNGTAQRFAQGAGDLASVALMVGFARSIALLMEEGQVLHTVVHGFSRPLEGLPPVVAAVGMLGVQTVINLFIPSGSGQAYATMPIMAPLADVLGLERQVAVLAYQYGDGFSNLLIPTNIVLMAILGMAGVSYERWVRFAAPLLLKLTGLAVVALAVAVWTGYR